MSYTLEDYVVMVGDRHRTEAYARALEHLVTHESVVLDLGAGFGFFAILAARLGARHAYAIETNDAIGLGPALARANGVADRVTFIQGDPRQVTLPERASVLVEDIRGILPLHQERIRLLRDARERLLQDGATLVAVRDRLWAAPARQPATMRDDLHTIAANQHGVDLSSLRTRLLAASRRGKLRPEDLLLPGAGLGDLELTTVTDPHFEGTARWTTVEPIAADGFALWFDAELAGGEGFSTRPGPEQTVHGCLYLPLHEPLSLPAHADLSLRFVAVPVSGDYAWAWEVAWDAQDGSGVRRRARQSTLGAVTLTPLRLAARSELHRPVLGGEGQRLREALSMIDGRQTSGAIASALFAKSELGFSTEADAFDWVQDLLPLLTAAPLEHS